MNLPEKLQKQLDEFLKTQEIEYYTRNVRGLSCSGLYFGGAIPIDSTESVSKLKRTAHVSDLYPTFDYLEKQKELEKIFLLEKDSEELKKLKESIANIKKVL